MKTTNLPLRAFLDEVLGNVTEGGIKRTVRITKDDLIPPPVEVYDIAFRFPDNPAGNEVLDFFVSSRDFILPANLTGSVGFIDTRPGAAFVMTIRTGGTLAPETGTARGTVTVNAAGVFTFASTGGAPVTIAVGTLVKVVAQALPDATAQGIAFTLQGTLA